MLMTGQYRATDRLKMMLLFAKQTLLYFLVLPGHNEHFAPSICMSAFSIKVQQHNEEAQMNMSLSKSISASYMFRLFINSHQICPRA